MLYTVLSALPVVSHIVQLFLEPYAVCQVLAFFKAAIVFIQIERAFVRIRPYTLARKRNNYERCFRPRAPGERNRRSTKRTYERTNVRKLSIDLTSKGSLRSPQ